jgi:hypothetical protein
MLMLLVVKLCGFVALNMEALCFSETLIPTYKSTRRYNPEDEHRHLHLCDNLRSLQIHCSMFFFLLLCGFLLTAEIKYVEKAVPWLRSLVAGLSPRKSGFAPGSIHVGFVVDKVALWQFFSNFFGLPLSISFHRRSPNSYQLGNA